MRIQLVDPFFDGYGGMAQSIRGRHTFILEGEIGGEGAAVWVAGQKQDEEEEWKTGKDCYSSIIGERISNIKFYSV